MGKIAPDEEQGISLIFCIAKTSSGVYLSGVA
jgi:hypothetical protein